MIDNIILIYQRWFIIMNAQPKKICHQSIAKQASKNNDTVLLTGDGDTILGGSRCHASYFARSSFYNNFFGKFFVKLSNNLTIIFRM